MVKKLTKKEQEAYINSNKKQVNMFTNLFIAGIILVFGVCVLGILALIKFLWTYLVG